MKHFSISVALWMCSLLIGPFSNAQDLIVGKSIRLPKDTVTRAHLLRSLNGFLAGKDSPARQNTFVLQKDLLTTSALLDEMKGIERDADAPDSALYRGYLTNVVAFNDTDFLVQISYMNVYEQVPALQACFTLRAVKRGDRFYFRSPLRYNTSTWKTMVIGKTRFYYKQTFNSANAKKYFAKISEYDKRLNGQARPTEFYCCDDFAEVSRILGVDYKRDYNGYAHISLTASELDTSLSVNGSLTADFAKFDPHDLWHARLRQVMSPAVINRPVDEGCAYLYGGSWGLGWREIFQKFLVFAKARPDADWLALYNESKNFESAPASPLNVDFAINALIIQRLEQKKGFAAVMELLRCGKKEAGNENYFAALERIAGISKADFNREVSDLIKDHR